MADDELYEEAVKRVEENAKLLWMCRKEGEVWYKGIEDIYYAV